MTLEEQIMKLQTYKMFEGEDTVYVERDDVLELLEQEPKTDTLDKIRAEIERTETNSYIRDIVKGYINELSIQKDDYKGIMGWIHVSERLPKAGEYIGDVPKYYLVQNEYGDMLVARYTHSEYWEQIYQLQPIGDEIVAWMPLPQPYKAESETETWHGMNGMDITAPKGTFDKIFHDATEDEDDI